MSIEALTPQRARRFGVGPDAGILIVDVERRGPAERADCRPGDLLVKIGRNRVVTPDDLGAILDGVKPSTPADLTLWRLRGGEVWEISGKRIYSR